VEGRKTGIMGRCKKKEGTVFKLQSIIGGRDHMWEEKLYDLDSSGKKEGKTRPKVRLGFENRWQGSSTWQKL